MSTPVNPVGWFEIYVNDMDKMKTFYETVLGYELEYLPFSVEGFPEMETYAFHMHKKGEGAPGALVKMDGHEAKGNAVMVYFTVEDCAVNEARVEAAGGKIKNSKFSIGEYGFTTHAIDPEGNEFGIHSEK